ncbi:acyltransferase [Clostridium sp. E02]|uniref:acyltransferase n=1 Tax=Clostridium sp. E02 TaxID=2487134 RepID=UPI001FAA1482|nr:acyltransferase [Clostridium sp. E02]
MLESKRREVKYDHLRSLAVVAIIMVHAIPAESTSTGQWVFSAALLPVLLSFVGIYFMLSGLFLLSSHTEDILRFYKKRIQMILVPFACYSGIYYWYYKVYLGQDTVGFFVHIGRWLKALMTGTIPMAPHLWFMYVILALYLCTPFLARMFHAMSDGELKLFLVLILVVQSILLYLPELGFSVEESLQYMIFKGWFIYFVLGYGVKRLYHGRPYLMFGILGLTGFLITMLQKCFTPYFAPGIHDLAPTMIAISLSIFWLFEISGDCKNKVLCKITGFISRFSFSVYLIHYLILGEVAGKITERLFLRHYYVPRILFETALTFILSLAVAWILDGTVIHFIIWGLRKLDKTNRK